MSTAAERAFERTVRTNLSAGELSLDVGRSYRWVFDRLKADLSDRLQRYMAGLPAGGVPSKVAQEAIMREAYEALHNLINNLHDIAPDVADVLSGEMRRLVVPELQGTFDFMQRDAPVNARLVFSTIANRTGDYAPRGSLLREKILERIEGGQYWKTGAAPPIHHRLLLQTEGALRDAVTSGETFTETVLRLEKEVFGVDHLKGDTHPAKPNYEGKILDPDYGKRPGFARPDNPNGVLGDVKRLVRTEMNEAYHEGFDKGLSEARDELGGTAGDIEYPPWHPNCYCSATGPVFGPGGTIIGVHIEYEGGEYGINCPICGEHLGNDGDILFS